MNVFIKIITPTLLLASLAGCGDSVDSKHIKTSGFHSTFRIYGGDGETRIDARLTTGGPNGSDIELSEGDVFTATAYGNTKVLEREPADLLGITDTYTTKYWENESGALVRLKLRREDGVNATGSYVRLPPLITYSSHNGGETLSFTGTTTIVWDDNFDGRVGIYAGITCEALVGEHSVSGSEYVELTQDPTMHEFVFADLFHSTEDYNNIDTSQSCEGSFYLERVTDGVLDSNLDAGNIKGHQTEWLNFNVTI